MNLFKNIINYLTLLNCHVLLFHPLTVYIVVRVLIRFTVTAKGSSYGTKKKSSSSKPETNQNSAQENKSPNSTTTNATDKKED